MIKLKSISFTDNDKKVLDEINLWIKYQQKVVLTGPSGSGKSSILKIIIGALIPVKGSYEFNEEIVNHRNIAKIRNSIAFVGQEPILGEETVRDALMLPFKFKQNKSILPDREIVYDLLERLKLNRDILFQKVGKLSGGEKQRLAIIRALLLKKKVFLLDEVTSALDPDSKKAVIAELSKPEYTVLSVSHDPEWIAKCQLEYVVKKGRIHKARMGEMNGN